MSRILNISYSVILGLKYRDVSNSFKIYNAELIKPLSLKCNNFDVVEEILVKINRNREINFIEVPFSFKKRMFGKTKRNLFRFIVTYIYTLIKLWLMK